MGTPFSSILEKVAAEANASKRKAKKSDFRPIRINAIQVAEFQSYSEWDRDAASSLSAYRYNEIVAIDANNNVCQIGLDYMAARQEKAFPVKVYQYQFSSSAYK